MLFLFNSCNNTSDETDDVKMIKHKLVSGTLFLDGPDERRVEFTANTSDSNNIVELFSELNKTKDLRAQGIAIINFNSKLGKVKKAAVTSSNLVRIDGKAYHIDNSVLLPILQKYWNTPKKNNPDPTSK